MYKNSIELLKHINEECIYLISVKESCSSYQEFISNETLKRAVVRSLEVIGEATKKIPIDVKIKWNLIKWKQMAGMRDRLIHDYMGVNYNIVWDVVVNIIPELQIQILAVILSDGDL